MKSVIATQFGGPEVLEVRDVPVPEPGEGEVLVKVKAAGVNYADIMQREGRYPGGPRPPFAVGFEIAGMVERLGPGVTEWQIGDAVMGFCTGGYSEYAIASAAGLMQKPHKMDFAHAVAIPCQYLTAYHALLTLGKLTAGETVLIQAAAGGLGTMLVQVAKNYGARVIGTCSGGDKLQVLKQISCDYPINYVEKDFVNEVKEITGGQGCSLIVESVGGEVFDKSLRCLSPRGRMITLGAACGQPGTVDALQLLFHNWTVSGFHLFAYVTDAEAMVNALRDLNEWIAGRRLTIYTNHTLPLRSAAEAHQRIQDRKTYGKVLLDMEW
ncbi:MAG: Quinone oxidoreductase [Candidatus Hydrogenedentes bacterium]|nr:Quinone oxidoreductase [Candidatus Hydrogenedentota bacterium]